MLVEAPLAAAAFPRTLRYPLQSSKHNCRTIRFSCPPVTIIHLLPTPEKGFQFHTSFFSSTSSITRAFNTITHKHNAPCLCRRRRPSIVATIVCPMPQRLPSENNQQITVKIDIIKGSFASIASSIRFRYLWITRFSLCGCCIIPSLSENYSSQCIYLQKSLKHAFLRN